MPQKSAAGPAHTGTGTSVALNAPPGSAICHLAAETPSTVNFPAAIPAGSNAIRRISVTCGSCAITVAGGVSVEALAVTAATAANHTSDITAAIAVAVGIRTV